MRQSVKTCKPPSVTAVPISPPTARKVKANSQWYYGYTAAFVIAITILAAPQCVPYLLLTIPAIILVVWVRHKLALARITLREALETEQRITTISDALPQLIWGTNAKGEFVYRNKIWHDYTGMQGDNYDSDFWSKVIHPEDAVKARMIWKEALAIGMTFTVEYRLKSNLGHYHWFLSRGMPSRDADGRITQWWGSCTDIDDMKQLQDDAINARRLLQTKIDEQQAAAQHKDDFLAMLGHELRNPLAPVLNCIHIMKQTARDNRQKMQNTTQNGCQTCPYISLDNDTMIRCQETIERQSLHMSRLLDDLLEVSRIKRGKVRLRRELVDMCPLVERVINCHRQSIDTRLLNANVAIPEEPILVYADPTRLEQVVSNLLNNACKYTEPGGSIWITVTIVSGRAILKVRDTGIGISKETLPRIFDLFSQAERSLDRAQGGLGIGLTLVKDLVEMHAGGVYAHSDGMGCGSEFTITLPLATDMGLPKYHTRKESNHAHKSCKILIVDDNVDAAESIGYIMRMYGHTTEIVHDGNLAIQAVARNLPEVVLLDIGLPNLDGFRVCEKLRQLYGNEMKIIAVTGYGSDEDRRQGERVGFNAHLTKPVDPKDLHDTIISV